MNKSRESKHYIKMNNEGFTLMELLVSLAIMAVVAAAVSAFIISGNKSYLRGNNAVTVQEEAQISVNQMIDLIIDVNKKIDWKQNGNIHELRLYNKDETYMLRFQGDDGSGDSANNKIYLYKTVAMDTEAFSDITAHTGYLLAEYVTDFQVDLSKTDEKGIVGLTVSFDYQGKTYDVTENIKLRNYRKESTGEKLSWIEEITISPEEVTTKAGTVVPFSYTLKGDQEAVSKGVTWKVEAVDGYVLCGDTVIDSEGKLVIGLSQQAGEKVLKVTVSSVADPTKKATAVVTIEEDKVFDKGELIIRPHVATLNEQYTEGWLFWEKTEQQYAAIFEVLPDYADYLEGYPKDITWELLSPNNLEGYWFEEITNLAQYGLEGEPRFFIKFVYRGEMDEAIPISVQATATVEEGTRVKSNVQGLVIPPVSDVFIMADKLVLDRKGSISMQLKKRNSKGEVFDYDEEDKNVTWRIANPEDIPDLMGNGDDDSRMIGFGYMEGVGGADSYDSYGNTRNLNLTYQANAGEVPFYAKHYIDFDKEYYVTVEAVDQYGEVLAQTNLLVPEVEVLFLNGSHYMSVPRNSYYKIFYMKVYGYTQDPDGDGNEVRSLTFTGELQAEKAFGSNTKIAGIELAGGGNWVALDVDWQEPNDYFVLLVNLHYTSGNGELVPVAKRSLLFLVED